MPRLLAWVATAAIAAVMVVFLAQTVPWFVATPAATVAPLVDTPCIVALSGSSASIEVTGDDPEAGCAYLETVSIDPKRWYRATSYVNGPTVCTHAGVGRTYTVRDQGTYLIDGNAWCRALETVSLP